jgi:hypothetical protein
MPILKMCLPDDVREAYFSEEDSCDEIHTGKI